MKTKISVNIDSELLGVIKDCSDSDFDSIIQDALSQFFGVKQIWVRTDTLDPISVSAKITPDIITQDKIIQDKITGEIDDNKNTKMAINSTKRRRQPKFVLKVWDKLKVDLDEEFVIDDYWNATKKHGLDYKESARHSTIPEHLKLIEEAGKIIKISDKPKTYRKLETGKLKSNELQARQLRQLESGQQKQSDSEPSESERKPSESEPSELERQKPSESERQKPSDPDARLKEILEHGKDAQNRERIANRDVLI